MDWTVVISAIAGVIGGGGGIWAGLAVYYKQKIDRTAQQHVHSKDHQSFLNQQNQELVLGLQNELVRERKRVVKLEGWLEDVRKELAEEYAKDIAGQAEINRLKENIANLCKGRVVSHES